MRKLRLRGKSVQQRRYSRPRWTRNSSERQESVVKRPAPASILRRALLFSAQTSGLLTIASGALATFFNVLVFNAWGLSFLSVATLEDVLVGALRIGGYIAIFFISVLAGWRLHLSFVRRARNWREQTRFRFETSIFFTICIAAGSGGETDPTGIGFVVGMGALCGYVASFIMEGDRSNRRVIIIATLISIAGSVGAVATYSFVYAKYLTERGYTVLPHQGRCSQGRAIWIGVKSIIFVCELPAIVGGRQQRVKFAAIADRQNVTIIRNAPQPDP